MKNVEFIYWLQNKNDSLNDKIKFVVENIHQNGSLFYESQNSFGYLVKFLENIKNIPLPLQHLIVVKNPITVGCKTSKLSLGYSMIAHFAFKNIIIDKKVVSIYQSLDEGEPTSFWINNDDKYKILLKMVDILPESPILDISSKPITELKESSKLINLIYLHKKV